MIKTASLPLGFGCFCIDKVQQDPYWIMQLKSFN